MRTRHTKAGGVDIAYQVVGDGPVDLVFVPGIVSHVEMQWADPSYARFLRRLASFSRLILFDKRGTGASERVTAAPDLERAVEDLRMVMNAAASERAVVLGFSTGAPSAAVFAATYPQRCAALVMCASAARARFAAADVGMSDGQFAEWMRLREESVNHWGEGRGMDLFAPSLGASNFHRQAWALFERAAATREMVLALAEVATSDDVRTVMPSIDVPTLCLHRRDDFIPIALGREVASLIPGARFVELEGSDHVPYAGDASSILIEIERFLRELELAPPRPEQTRASLLFTDIVGSTKRIVEVGDERWRETLQAHDELARWEVDRHHGRVDQSTGDGILATFDRPVDAVRCAWAIREQAHRLPLEIRAGVHTGDCELIGDRLGGLAVHAANRIMSAADPGEILVSEPTRRLLTGSRLTLATRGSQNLKGLPDQWELFAVEGEPAPDAHAALPAPPELGLPDRLQVGVARRAPWLARGFGRVAGRNA